MAKKTNTAKRNIIFVSLFAILFTAYIAAESNCHTAAVANENSVAVIDEVDNKIEVSPVEVNEEPEVLQLEVKEKTISQPHRDIDFIALQEMKAIEEAKISTESDLNSDEFLFFQQIVSAETMSFWGTEACAYIATVIMNRVESDKFPNTITEVLVEKGQFETYSNGLYKTQNITPACELACKKVVEENYRALDSSVLYFCTEKYYATESSSDFFHSLNQVDSVNNVLFFTE